MATDSWTTLDGTMLEGRRVEFYALWAIATLAYGVGDLLTTLALVFRSGRVFEANGLLRFTLGQFGPVGLVAVKLAVFFCCLVLQLYLLRTATDDDGLFLLAPPVVLALVGTFVTVYNVRLLLG